MIKAISQSNYKLIIMGLYVTLTQTGEILLSKNQPAAFQPLLHPEGGMNGPTTVGKAVEAAD